MALPVTTAGFFYTSDAAAADYRVSSYASGEYHLNGTMTSSLFGTEIIDYDEENNPITQPRSVSLNRTLDSEFKYSYGNNSGNVPEPAAFDRTFSGDSSIGAGNIQVAGYAATDWGSNHAKAAIGGFTKIEKNVTAYPNILGVPDTNNPINIDYATSAQAYASSQWEELYQIAGGPGSSGTTGNYSVTMHIDGILNGLLNANDSAHVFYQLTTFNDEDVLSLSAGINSYWDDESGTLVTNWYKSIDQGSGYNSEFGSGDLVIDQDLHGSYEFTYGDPLYLRSYLSVSINGNAINDFSNTVTMKDLVLPENALVYALSGTNMSRYNASFAGNGNGTFCDSLECVNSGFGGGSNVPVPAACWLFLSGLMGWLGFGSRRSLKTV